MFFNCMNHYRYLVLEVLVQTRICTRLTELQISTQLELPLRKVRVLLICIREDFTNTFIILFYSHVIFLRYLSQIDIEGPYDIQNLVFQKYFELIVGIGAG